MRSFAFSIAAALMIAFNSAGAKDDSDPYGPYRAPNEPGGEFRFDDSLVEQWKEQQADVPLLSEQGLKPVEIDHGPPGMSFLIDMDTLSVNPDDRVVRYWLVMEAGGRRTNVLYEGINCIDASYKTYAYASARRLSLIKYMESPKWEAIRGLSDRDYHYELLEDFFCTDGSPRSMHGIAAAVAGRMNTNDPYYQDSEFVPR